MSGTNAGVKVSTKGSGGGGGDNDGCGDVGSALGWMAIVCGGTLGLTIGGCGEGDGDYVLDAGPLIITDIGDAWSNEKLVHVVGVNPLEADRDHLPRKDS